MKVPSDTSLTFRPLRTPFAFTCARTGQTLQLEGFWCTPTGRHVQAVCTQRGTILRRPDEIPAGYSFTVEQSRAA
jgi:hypothetical protein